MFEDLVQRSAVDEADNAKTVGILRDLERQQLKSDNSTKWWKRLRIANIIAAIAFAWPAYAYHWAWAAGGIALLVVLFAKLNPLISSSQKRSDRLLAEINTIRDKAFAQMAPLNALFDWPIFSQLVTKTVPRIALDPCFTDGRLNNLRNSFGWDDSFNNSRSVKFAHSGVINGNPFVFAQTMNHWMGQKDYQGSITIHWTDRVYRNGKWESESRSQTLTATVTKPFPSYDTDSTLIYGNGAAPDLSFTRSPSDLSKLEDNMIGKWRKGSAIKKLEKKSRTQGLTGGFTTMSNPEFDALFSALDRDHEVQFRMLFTPLAQQEMLKLLRDKEVGFGDNFSFRKRRRINMIEAAHLRGMDISAEPRLFQGYELAQMRQFFNSYHNSLFKAFYFAFAPVLSIPLYQQHRPHEDIYAGVLVQPSCFWEHESMANYMGENSFSHPQSITRNILKTTSVEAVDDTQRVQVTAYGYRGEARTDYVSMRGGDGRTHRVPVNWTEYLPVEQSSEILVCDTHTHKPDAEPTGWQERLGQYGLTYDNVLARRSLWAARLT